jgi:hypothetical protein
MDRDIAIRGIGVVNALGGNAAAVFEKLDAGVPAEPVFLERESGGPVRPVYRAPVPQEIGRREARLRRSSVISLFACAAALEAIEAGGNPSPGSMALVFATTNGAVIYTRKFYHDIVAGSPGSPLLFPETVYNAPASHVAAMLGIDGEVLTLVSDATSGMDALRTGWEILSSGAAETCLVIAAEEVDWITCEAYRRWGLARGPQSDCGAVLSEGATALLLGPARPGEPLLQAVHQGVTYHRRQPVSVAIDRVVADLLGGVESDLVVGCASGTRFDRVEEKCLAHHAPAALRVFPKLLAGEAFAASSLLQTALAARAITAGAARRALVPVIGWNGQTGGALLTGRATPG